MKPPSLPVPRTGLVEFVPLDANRLAMFEGLMTEADVVTDAVGLGFGQVKPWSLPVPATGGMGFVEFVPLDWKNRLARLEGLMTDADVVTGAVGLGWGHVKPWSGPVTTGGFGTVEFVPLDGVARLMRFVVFFGIGYGGIRGPLEDVGDGIPDTDVGFEGMGAVGLGLGHVKPPSLPVTTGGLGSVEFVPLDWVTRLTRFEGLGTGTTSIPVLDGVGKTTTTIPLLDPGAVGCPVGHVKPASLASRAFALTGTETMM